MDASEQSGHQVEEERFRRLIDVGSSLLSELDLEAVLKSVVDAARELTGARYAALGVLDPERRELERFINVGIDEEIRRDIGNLPRGRGVLGELIREPAPLRLRDVNSHPHAYGFPPGHPPMHSFLGVPISVRGETYGNLYMTEKQGAEQFDETDEEAAITLASWAGIAIENARLYTSLSEREAEIEQALRRAETSVDIARTVGGETDVNRVLDLIVKRARALVDARALLVLLRRGDHLYVAARAGEVTADLNDLEVPLDDAVFGGAMEERVSQRLERGSPPSKARLRERLGAEAALVVPLLFRGRAVGVLVALDREAGGVEFDQEDLRLLQSFAASAATAVATAQTVESDRLLQQVEAAENERQRWARELHDDTLQGLAAIRISLATALQSKGDRREALIESAAEEAMAQLEGQINELNRLINDLRPAALERLGLAGALQALAEETGARGGVAVEVEIEIGEAPGGDEERLVYRLVQEALTNIVKHASAARVEVSVREEDCEIEIVVRDDGEGFDPTSSSGGRGLIGMRERIELLGGSIEVTSAPGDGTAIAATVPLSEGS
ncbi:MAG TPA: GAF domain-containing sensor histidine kinase [Solirubrobacterales bacterium]|jgi:signal transduction histidine kinase|nr:GAF domain-containing sensor histidine kinase [Solirubrobacterales bacterium]